MLKVKTITPIYVTAEELSRRQARYDRLSPSSLKIEMVNLPAEPAVPRSLNTETACRTSDQYVYQTAMATDPTTCDAILLDCVLDPALEQLEKDAPLPVFGILKLSVNFLASMGQRVAAVTRNQVIGEALEARIKAYGLEAYFHTLILLNLSFADIADDKRWNAALSGALAELEEADVQALINGCSAVNVDLDEKYSTKVVDPTELALKLLGLAASEKLVGSPVNFSLTYE